MIDLKSRGPLCPTSSRRRLDFDLLGFGTQVVWPTERQTGEHARSQIRRLHFIWGKNVGKDQGNSDQTKWSVEGGPWVAIMIQLSPESRQVADNGRWESHNLDQEENPNKCTCTCTVWVGHPNRYVLLYTYKKPLPQLVTRPSRQQLPLNRLHTTTKKNNSRLGFSIGLDKSLTWVRLEGITDRGVLPTER